VQLQQLQQFPLLRAGPVIHHSKKPSMHVRPVQKESCKLAWPQRASQMLQKNILLSTCSPSCFSNTAQKVNCVFSFYRSREQRDIASKYINIARR
jgi:hypothetical protein